MRSMLAKQQEEMAALKAELQHTKEEDKKHWHIVPAEMSDADLRQRLHVGKSERSLELDRFSLQTAP